MADLDKLNELPIEIRNRVNNLLTAGPHVPPDADTAFTDVAQAFTKNQYTVPVALTWGANVAIDASASGVFTLTLTGATAELSNPTNLVAGQSFMVVVTQDGDGGRELTFDTKYSFGAVGAPDLTTSLLNVVDIVSCHVVSTTKIACTVLRGF